MIRASPAQPYRHWRNVEGRVQHDELCMTRQLTRDETWRYRHKINAIENESKCKIVWHLERYCSSPAILAQRLFNTRSRNVGRSYDDVISRHQHVERQFS